MLQRLKNSKWRKNLGLEYKYDYRPKKWKVQTYLRFVEDRLGRVEVVGSKTYLFHTRTAARDFATGLRNGGFIPLTTGHLNHHVEWHIRPVNDRKLPVVIPSKVTA